MLIVLLLQTADSLIHAPSCFELQVDKYLARHSNSESPVLIEFRSGEEMQGDDYAN